MFIKMQPKGKTMKHFTILLILTLLLNGCTTKPASETIADNAVNTINTMYNSLPKECQTKNVTDLRDNSIKEVRAVVHSCEEEKALLYAKISHRNTIIASLCALILLCVGASMFLKRRL